MAAIEQAKRYILAIDQSTTASKVMFFDQNASLIHKTSKPHRQYYPKPGFVEHDATEIFENVCIAIEALVEQSGVPTDAIAALAITNQRETALIWDRNTGNPIDHAAVWQCQRGAPFCRELKNKGLDKRIKEKTGLLVDPYFSASKLRWIMDHTSGAKAKAAQGDLLLGTMDSWLLWKLSGGKIHATDYTNACRTMLFNIDELKWDEELIEIFGLNIKMFPEVRFSDEIFGNTAPEVVLNRSIPIAGLIGDSHGAFFGQHCYAPGIGKCTYGTGSSVMINIGKKPMAPPQGLVTSIGFGCDQSIDYVFEGNIHCTGDTINWLKNELQLIKDAAETESLASSVDHNGGVYMVPAFVGLGAPYWDNDARACIVGMSRDTTRAYVVRAALESIAYQVKDLVDLMASSASTGNIDLRVDGGPTRNHFLMQFQADVLQGPIVRSNIEEISALGAVYLAGMAIGWWHSLEEIEALRMADKTFHPNMSAQEVEQLYLGWQAAVKKART